MGNGKKNRIRDIFSRLDRPCDFFIIRHAESLANAEKRIQGKSEFPLSPLGREQAAFCGQWLADKNISGLYSSPIGRARETSDIVCANAGIAGYTSDKLLGELETGVFTGLRLEDARELYPDDWARFRVESWDGVTGAESSTMLAERAFAVWEFLISRANELDGNIAAISHGGIVQWIVRIVFDNRQWFPLFPMANCGIWKLAIKPVLEEKDSSEKKGRKIGVYFAWEELNFQAGPDTVTKVVG